MIEYRKNKRTQKQLPIKSTNPQMMKSTLVKLRLEELKRWTLRKSKRKSNNKKMPTEKTTSSGMT